jgi:predicted transcriptional regulator
VSTIEPEDFNSSELTADIVTALVAHNSLPIGSVAALIQSVHAALTQLATEPLSATLYAPHAPLAETREPAVPIRKSVTPDYMVCLEDGRKFQSMRRHLASLGMTPEQYRAKWSLPADYPMIAANYAALRSEISKKIGFGRNDSPAAPHKRGRRPKAGK